jgi:hypothetical protein
MFLKTLKNSEKYFWTEHAKFKMKFYGLSPQRVLRVIRAPERTEEGIVEKTIAVMQPASTRMKNGKKVWSQEIWAMYQARRAGNSKSEILNPKLEKLNPNKLMKLPACQSLAVAGRQANKLKIISAWRYPGMSPKKDPIPEDILREIEEVI